MRILSVSDKVDNQLLTTASNSLPAAPELILACGDLPPEYLTELRAHYNVPLYFVEGNHDIRNHRSPPVGCTNIHTKIVTEQGLRIMGFAGSRWYNGGINQFTERQMKKFIRSLWLQMFTSNTVNIIISHAPPRFIHDQNDPCHRGFRCFTSLIKRQRPNWFVHGHIHAFFDNPAERITTLGNTKVLNSYGFFFFETELVEETTAGQ